MVLCDEISLIFFLLSINRGTLVFFLSFLFFSPSQSEPTISVCYVLKRTQALAVEREELYERAPPCTLLTIGQTIVLNYYDDPTNHIHAPAPRKISPPIKLGSVASLGSNTSLAQIGAYSQDLDLTPQQNHTRMFSFIDNVNALIRAEGALCCVNR